MPEFEKPQENQCHIPKAICHHKVKSSPCVYFAIGAIRGICKYLDQGCYCKSQVAEINVIQEKLLLMGFIIKARV